MGKVSMCIQLLEILNSGKVYKVSELARLLETNPRNIVDYKSELERDGYYINSIPGRYGGYQLDKWRLLPSLNLNSSEQQALDSGTSFILSSESFIDKDSYLKAIGKITTSVKTRHLGKDIKFINRVSFINNEELKQSFDFINDNIKHKTTISFRKNNELFSFDPYELFMFDNSWYVIGWNNNSNDISYFKLVDIKNLEKTTKRFIVYKYYKLIDFIDEFGFKNIEWFNVSFKVLKSWIDTFKELAKGKNLEVIDLNDSYSTINVEMQNEDDIINFAINYSSFLVLLKPIELRDKILNKIEEINNIYK